MYKYTHTILKYLVVYSEKVVQFNLANYHLINLKRRKMSEKVHGHSVRPVWLRA